MEIFGLDGVVVGVGSKFDHGVSSLDDAQPEPLTCMPLRAALEQRWTDDAHFYTYEVPQFLADQTPWWRINKRGTAVAELRAIGADVQTRIGVIDFDVAPEGGWTEETRNAFLETLANLPSPIADWSVLYFTRGGARLIYCFSRPLPVEHAEPVVRGLCVALTSAGLAADLACCDWTRCFRLPQVTREGSEEWHQWWCHVEIREAVLDVDRVAVIGEPARVQTTAIQRTDWNVPTPEEARKLLEVGDHKTEWAKAAKRRLVGRDCYGYLFEHQMLHEGERDEGLSRLVGEAIQTLYPTTTGGLTGTRPEHVYALFSGVAEQLTPDRDHPDWLAKLAYYVGNYWSGSAAQFAQEAARVAEVAKKEEHDACTLAQRVLQGMRSWCDIPALHDEDENKSLAWLNQRMIVAAPGETHFVMRPDGFYDSIPVTGGRLNARIRELGMDLMMPIDEERDGRLVPKAPNKLLRDHATIVETVRAEPELQGARIDRISTARSAFVMSLYERRKDLIPTFDADVDQWLEKLGGQMLKVWLAWALAWEEGPICALSIAGPPGIGKGMLVAALQECTVTGELATGGDLVGDHGTGPLRSPWLVINEGFPVGKGSKSPADAFRRIVSGEIEPVNPKYQALIHIRNPMRVILTGNGLDVVQVLTGGRDLSPDDSAALAARLLHITATKAAGDWLRERGFFDFTGSPGRRWVAGVGGMASDFVVAKHLLWLHKNRGKKPGKRFLVDGAGDSEILFDLRLSGAALPVVECIVDMLNAVDEKRIPAIDGLTIEGNKIYVLSGAISDFARRNRNPSSRMDSFNQRQLANALSGLRSCTPTRTLLKSRLKVGKSLWSELDSALLLDVAEKRLQKPCAVLRRIASGATVTDMQGKVIGPPIEGEARA